MTMRKERDLEELAEGYADQDATLSRQKAMRAAGTIWLINPMFS